MTLPLSNIVYATVQVLPQGVQPPTFNQALIVGNSAVLPTYGATGRCRQYTGGTSILTAMLADGFTLTSPEYLAASFYVQQVPTPYSVWIGRQDATAIGSFVISSGGAGTNYVVGDQVGVTQSGGSNALLKITAVDGSGAVTALQFVQQGTGYSTVSSNNLACPGGTGSGLRIDISTLGESALAAVQACRIVSPTWYLFTCLTANDTDNIALATWAQTASPVTQLFFQTASASALNGTAGNIFSTLKAAGLNRYQGTYTTTQSGVAPNNTYFSAALMGLAMGLNTGLSNSYFNLPNKTIVGMVVESLTPTQFATISGNYGNAYCSYGGVYNSFSPGITGSGQYFDQILTIDMLVADLQFAELAALQIYPAVGQNDAGQAILLHAANTACQKSVKRGSISGGIWTGPTVLGLQAGMNVPGFINQSPSYASFAQKPANRQSVPIYCAVNLTEAVQQIVLAIYVQQ